MVYKAGNPGNPNGRKGLLGKLTTGSLAFAEKMAETYGVSPLEFLFMAFTDEGQDMKVRVAAAGKAAPYCHKQQPKALEIGPTQGNPISAQDIARLPREERLQFLALLDKIGALDTVDMPAPAQIAQEVPK